MKVQLKPLTPLWTGNNDGLSSELRVTGLMGSLRWWWEGMVRAYGRYACDPTSGACGGDGVGKPICAGCRLFGCTGWARRFRLSATGLSPQPWYVLVHPGIARMHEGWLTRVVKDANNAKVLWGDQLELTFEQYLEDENWEKTEACLKGLLKVVAGYGGLGAKTQNGYGSMGLRDSFGSVGKEIEAFFCALEQKGELKTGANNPKWFDLSRTMFLAIDIPNPGIYATNAVRIPARVRASYDSAVLPVAYEIRYKSETEFRGRGKNVGLRPALKAYLEDQGIKAGDIASIVGSAADDDERIASRVFVSHLYRPTPRLPYRLKLWIHVPDDESGMSLVDQRKLAQFIGRYVMNDVFPGSKAMLQTWPGIKEAL